MSELRIEARVPWREQLWRDARGFVQAYCACFFGVLAFIA